MVLTLVALVAAFVIFFQFIRPAYQAAQEVRGEVIARENLLEQQTAAIAEVKKLIEKYRQDTVVQETVSQVIPGQPEVGSALYQLSAIAGQYGIQFQSTTAQTPQLSIAKNEKTAQTVGTVRPLGVATFQVRFTTTYDSLKSFLEKLESNVRIMDVTGITVTQAGASAGAGVLAVDLTVATYYQVTE